MENFLLINLYFIVVVYIWTYFNITSKIMFPLIKKINKSIKPEKRFELWHGILGRKSSYIS